MRAARAHGAFGAVRAEGPKGQGGHWDFSEGWSNGRVSKEEARLNCYSFIIVMPNAQTLYFFTLDRVCLWASFGGVRGLSLRDLLERCLIHSGSPLPF